MMKFAVVAAVAIAGMMVSSESAFAGRRCCRVRQCCCAAQTTCCNTGCNSGCNAGGCSAAPANSNGNPAPTPPIETPTAQANGYQSYSYEPGTAPVGQPAMTVDTAQPYRNYSASSYSQFRGDRKALGNY